MCEPPRPPLAVLSAPGSRGDVNPMLALGRGLRQSGFEVAIMLAEPYAPLADAVGLQPISLLTAAEFESFAENPQLWKPIGGPRALLRDMIPQTLETHYRALEAVASGRRTVLVSHPLDAASRIYRELHPEVPLVSVHLAPVLLRAPADPPRLTPWRLEPRAPAAAVRAAYWLADRVWIDRWLTPPLNRFRHSLGLPPVDRPLDRWWLSPDRILGLYPSWFAPGEASWPSRFRAVGFPLYDGPALGDSDTPASDRIERVLARFSEPPIVFTPGTAHVRARPFFAAAVEACRQLDRPGLMLTGRPEQVPAQVSASSSAIQVARYLPLGDLLPHCAAVVHHGGIGTTSQALAAGIPQLICPMAFDQFDNAERVGRLGCGGELRMRRVTPRRMRDALAAVLKDPEFARRAAEVREQVEPGEEAIARAVGEIVARQGVVSAVRG